jgi:hypothetical protein
MNSSSSCKAHHLDPHYNIIPGISAQDATFEAARLGVDVPTVCRYMRQYGDRDVYLNTSTGICVMPAYEAKLRIERDEPLSPVKH